MHFITVATDQAGFDAWVARARAAPPLDVAGFRALAVPGVPAHPALFGGVERGLFRSRPRLVHADAGRARDHARRLGRRRVRPARPRSRRHRARAPSRDGDVMDWQHLLFGKLTFWCLAVG